MNQEQTTQVMSGESLSTMIAIQFRGLSPEEARDKIENDTNFHRMLIDLIQCNEELEFRKIIAEQYPELLGILKSQREISTMEIPESEGMIDKGYRIAIIGEMQSGKSLLALRIGQDLVEGRPILNYFPWDKKWRVLYVNFELPEDEMHARFSLFGDNHNYVLLPMPIIALENDEEAKRIAHVLSLYREAGKPFDALILDPKACCMGGDENQTQDTMVWCAACDKLAEEDNLCLIIPHHFGANTSNKGGRGNTSFGGWLTKRLLLKGSDSAHTKMLSVYGKVGEPLELPIKLNYPFWEIAPEAISIKETRLSQSKTFILQHIPQDRTPLIRTANQAGITVSTFKEALKQLEREGLVQLVQVEGQPGNKKRVIPLSD